ncbi:MAG TPA: hypothetical protein VFU22_05630 [Roseiflexaceae bacterium]|nr:hypothetical protein [Roseiflexaceae bacterium]
MAQLAPGALDPTFAGFTDDGIVNPAGLANATSIAVQPDGKIVVVGPAATTDEFAVFRYLPNGQPDNTFDGDGKVSISNMFTAADVALQSDAKIVVAGFRGPAGFQVARLTPAGALDPSFGQGGWLNDNDIRLDTLTTVLVQRDGKIVVCGSAGQFEGEGDFAVTRYNANGARDFSFGNGIVFIAFGGNDLCYDSVQQADGKLVFAGLRRNASPFNYDDDFAVARLNSSGKLDSGFDKDGKLTTGFGHFEAATGVAIQPDGKIVALGSDYNANTSYMARYNSNGTLDKTFDGDGKLTIPVDKLWKVAVQPDGKMLAVGFHKSPDGDKKFAVYRLLASGALDTSFDFDGVAWLDFGGADDGFAVSAQPDGRILVAGTMGSAAVVARLWQNGTQFDTGGQQVQSLSFGQLYPPGSYATAFALATQADGKLLSAGELRNKAGTAAEAIITRFSPDGLLDRTFAVEGTAHLQIGGFTSARAMAIQPDGKIVIAGYSSISYYHADFMVARYLPTGAPDSSFGLNGTNYRLGNFQADTGVDKGTAIALAPDGKIVVVGSAWNGSAWVWGVARWNGDGTPDTTFDNDGLLLLATGSPSAANAVVVQPDKRILVGGNSGGNDFAVGRLLENGALDASFGEYRNGYSILDMGGNDGVTALALATDGRIYAAGYTYQGGIDAFAVTQYQPNGILTSCPIGQTCGNWPDGKRYIDIGGSDQPYAIALRGDNQLVVAGCSDQHMAAAQMSTTAIDQPIFFQVDFAGNVDCAYGVQFTGTNKDKVILAGQQNYDSLSNMALARFQTTASTSASAALAAAEEQQPQDTAVLTPTAALAEGQLPQDTAVLTPTATLAEGQLPQATVAPTSTATLTDEQQPQDTAVLTPTATPPLSPASQEIGPLDISQ